MNTGRPRRILYGITKSEPFGGAGVYVYDLALEAKSKGLVVAVVLGGKGALYRKLQEAGIQTFSIPSLARDLSIFDDSRSFIELMNVMHKFNPDVFHINSSKMGGIGGVAGRLMGVPKIIFTSHGWAFNESRPAIQKFVIKVFHWITVLLSHKTICVAESARRDFFSWPFVRNKLVVVKNGLEDIDFLSRTEARQILNAGEDAFLIGNIGELHYTKGQDVLLRAWKEFKKECDGKLVIMGEGEERENLEFLINLLGIQDSVTLLGRVENARNLLHGLDMYVHPSRSEAMPYAVLEAASAGLPIVASRVGGIPEIISHEESGILVEKEDPSELALAMINLAKDKTLRKKFGTTAKKEVGENFNKEKMVMETFSLYI